MDNEVKVRRYYGAIKILLVASLVCQFVGYVTPGWFQLNFSKDLDDSIGVQVNGELKKIIMLSLWYVVACVNKDSACGTFSLSDMEESMQVFKRGLVVPKVMTTIAFVTCLMALIGVWKTQTVHITSESRRIRAYITMMTSILSCTLSITSVTVVAQFYWSSTPSPVRFPFSLILTGLGGIMVGAAFTINIVMRPWKVVTLYSNAERELAFDNPSFTTNQPVANPAPLPKENGNGLKVQQGQGYSVYPTQQTDNAYQMTNQQLVASTHLNDSVQVQDHEVIRVVRGRKWQNHYFYSTRLTPQWISP